MTTSAGPLAVNGCARAVWGTATPLLDDLAKAERTVTERILERIAPGDSVLIFGRLRAESGRSIDNTGTGSLIIFGAPAAWRRSYHAAHRLRQNTRLAHSAADVRRSSKYVYATGTTSSVRIVAVVMPPTSVLPNGP